MQHKTLSTNEIIFLANRISNEIVSFGLPLNKKRISNIIHEVIDEKYDEYFYEKLKDLNINELIRLNECFKEGDKKTNKGNTK